MSLNAATKEIVLDTVDDNAIKWFIDETSMGQIMKITTISEGVFRVTLNTGAVYDVAQLSGEPEWFYTFVGDSGVLPSCEACLAHLQEVEQALQQGRVWPVDANGDTQSVTAMTPDEQRRRFAGVERQFSRQLAQPKVQQAIASLLAKHGALTLH